MRLFARGVSRKRLDPLRTITFNTLLACASVTAAAEQVEQWDAARLPDAADLSDPFDVARESRAANDRILRHMQTATLPASVTQDPFGACFQDLVDTSQDKSGVDRTIRDSAVMLHVIHRSPEGPLVSQGSGTIIIGEDGTRSILTAAHVADPGNGEIQEIVAYDHSGNAIGTFQITFSAEKDFQDQDNDAPDKLFQDIAVLHPIEFFGEVGVEAWMSGGLAVALDQSNAILSVLPDTTAGRAFSISQGMSGSGVVNGQGEVIGVIDEKLTLSERDRPFRKTGYAFDLSNDHNSGYLSDAMIDSHELLVDIAQSRTSFQDAIGIALPVVNDDALRVMGYDPSGITVSGWGEEQFSRAQAAGFPSANCQTSNLVVNPMSDLRITRATISQNALMNEIPEPVTLLQPLYFPLEEQVDDAVTEVVENAAQLPIFELDPIIVTSDPFEDQVEKDFEDLQAPSFSDP